jgi:membrane protein DedA with SNARE-associated domain
VAAALPTGSYPALIGLVLLGSIIPVVPTGALVSAAAAAVVTNGTYGSLAIIIVVSTIGAFIGDVATFALCRLLGERAVRWFRRGRAEDEIEPGGRLVAAEQRLVEHRVTVLVVARLIPAGRIPVLLAAGLSSISWRMFITAQLIAGVIWAAMYAAIGLAGGTIFDETWQAVVAALILVVALTVVTRQVQKIWQRRHAKAEITTGVEIEADVSER